MSNQRLPLIVLAAGLLAALVPATRRWHDEAAHRRVAIVIDRSEVEQLAVYCGQAPHQILAALRDAGATAVAIEEPVVDDLVKAGTLQVRPAGDGLELVTSRPAAAAALARLAGRAGMMTAAGTFYTTLPYSALAPLGTGFAAADLALSRQPGLSVVARLRNGPGLTTAALAQQLHQVAGAGVRTVIFSGDSILGYRELTAEVARQFARLKLHWGRIEFAKQKGEAALAEKLLTPELSQSYLRVHSITEGEMARLSPDLAIERYRRAAVERNIRVLFIRLLLDPSADPLARNRDFIAAVAAAVQQQGLTLGPAALLPYHGPNPRRVLPLGLLGVCSATAWLLALLPGYTTRRWLGLWLLLAVITTPLGLARPGLYARLMALVAGGVLPSIGLRWAWLRLTDEAPPRPLAPWLTVWGAAGWSLLGGLLVVGLCAETRYQLAHVGFAGVKLAQLVPLLFAGLLVATGLGCPGVDLAEARRRARKLWQSPVLCAHVVLAGAVAVLVLVMLVRSGNEGLEVSATELRFRTLLEHLFGARPRTKEVLLGYPALMFAAARARRARPAGQGPGAAVTAGFLLGGIGLVSSFNSFCHFHTPLHQALLRTFHALWVGSLLGLAAHGLLPGRRGDTRG